MFTLAVTMAISAAGWPMWGWRPEPPTPASTIALSLGIGPEMLAAAGADASDATELLARLGEARPGFAAFQRARNDATDAADAVVRLRDQIMTEGDTPELLAEFAAAEAAVISANQVVAEHTASLWVTALSGMEPGTVARLTAYRTAAGRRAPSVYKVCSLTGEEWDAVESALIAESRSVRNGEELRSEHSSTLAVVRSDDAVIQAGQQYDGLLLTLRLAFQSP